MNQSIGRNVKAWLIEPLPREVMRAVQRIARAEDVKHVAVMPDVHLARDVCVGLVIATERLIYPAAVGSDIGCGIAAIAFDAPADEFRDPRIADDLLAKLRQAVPIHRHRHGILPAELLDQPMSDERLETIRRREGSVQFGTLGRGNHFLEYQKDDEGRLWLMAHSGSRAIGQAIRDFHEARAGGAGNSLRIIEAESHAGRAYLSDAAWARRYANANRRAMIDAASKLAGDLINAKADWTTYFDCDHNHVQRETHFGVEIWVHRKGAMSAGDGEAGAIPGSMGTESFHVTGRGNSESLWSSSHGAGRAMSRGEARHRIGMDAVRRAMRGIHFDSNVLPALREESPAAYKDVRAVLRAEAELTRVVRRLRPMVVYKGE